MTNLWKKKQKLAYNSHKGHAKFRQIEFLFTFDEWLDTWIKSGKIDKRGSKSGEYCMARYNDRGPYSPENVEVLLRTQNTKDAWKINGAKLRTAISYGLKGLARPTISGLSDTDVTEIRQLFSNGISARKLAKQYSICRGTVSRIIHKKTYAKL